MYNHVRMYNSHPHDVPWRRVTLSRRAARIPPPGKKLMLAIRKFSGLTLRKNGDRYCPAAERKINFVSAIKRALFQDVSLSPL